MKEYLKNNICNLTPLFKIDYKKKYNLVSSCFFKLYGGGYKDFSIYLKGVKILTEYIREEMDDFKLRLFIDKSIYEDEKILNYLNNLDIQLVLYNCPDFKKNKIYHKGLFGTLVRFFPLFNFPNNDSKNVIITDIDFKNKEEVTKINSKEFYEISKEKKFFGTYLFLKGDIYQKRKNFKIIEGNNFYIYSIASSIIGGIKKMDHSVIVNFLNNVENYKKSLTFYEKKRSFTDSYTNFIFGVDEYFISKILRNYLVNENKDYFLNGKYIITGNIYHDIIEGNRKDDEYKNILNYSLQDIKNYRYRGIKNSFNVLDKIIYDEKHEKPFNKDHTELIKLKKNQEKIFFRIYEYFITIFKTKKNKYYNKDFLTLILHDTFLGYTTINFGLLKKNNIIKLYAFIYSKLPENLIEKLKKLKKEYGIIDKDLGFPKKILNI